MRLSARDLGVPSRWVGLPVQPAPAREVLGVDLLGPLRVRVHADPVAVTGLRQRALLVLLAMAAPQPVPVERILAVLFDGATEAATVRTLRSYVSKLRSNLGASSAQLRTSDGGYLLDLPAEALDVSRFRALLAAARELSVPELRLRTVDQALALWRGEPLVEVRRTAWGRSEARALSDAWMDAVVLRAHTRLAVGDHAAVASELKPLLDAHPHREDLAAVVLVSLYRSGRQVDALMLYPWLRDRLVSEFGVEPSPTLANVHTAILRHDPSLDG